MYRDEMTVTAPTPLHVLPSTYRTVGNAAFLLVSAGFAGGWKESRDRRYVENGVYAVF